MPTKRIENGCVAIEFDSETGEPKTCVIQVNESVLLTPNIVSAQALIIILKRLLVDIQKHKSKQNILANGQINYFLQTAKQEQSFEWKHIDAVRSESGEWKVWLNMVAVSVYVSFEEAKRIVGDFEQLKDSGE